MDGSPVFASNRASVKPDLKIRRGSGRIVGNAEVIRPSVASGAPRRGNARRIATSLFAGLLLRHEPAAGKKFRGGALAASDGTVHRPVVSAEIGRFSSKEQGITNRCS